MANVKRVRLGSVPTGAPLPNVRPTKEQGVSGTAIYAGFVQTKEKSSEWRGRERYRISSDIVANISIVAASVRHFLNLIAHPKWAVVPSDDNDPEAVMLAEFLEDVLHDMKTPFNRVVRRAATYQFHGFGVQEWIAKKRPDGLIGLKNIESRPQHTIERWSVSANGEVEGVWQRSPQDGTLYGLPRNKSLYLVEDTFTDSPEGLGIFRNLLEPYNRLKQYLALEARAFERDLRGTPIGRAPLQKLREMVDQGQIDQDTADRLIKGLQDFTELQVKESNTAAILDSQPYESVAADGPKVSGVMQWGLELLQEIGRAHV